VVLYYAIICYVCNMPYKIAIRLCFILLTDYRHFYQIGTLHTTLEATPPGSCSPASSRITADLPDLTLTSDSEYFSTYENQPDSDKDLKANSPNSPPTLERVEPIPASVDAVGQSEPP